MVRKKELLFFFLLFIGILLTGCQSKKEIDIDGEKIIVEYNQIKTNNYKFKGGVYYTAIGYENNISEVNGGYLPSNIIPLLEEGIDIKEIWFQQGKSSCGNLMVIVPPILIIMTSKDQPLMEDLGYLKLKDENPRFGSCQDSAMHYKIFNPSQS